MSDTICCLIYGNRREYRLEPTWNVASVMRFIASKRGAYRVFPVGDAIHQQLTGRSSTWS